MVERAYHPQRWQQPSSPMLQHLAAAGSWACWLPRPRLLSHKPPWRRRPLLSLLSHQLPPCDRHQQLRHQIPLPPVHTQQPRHPP